MSPLDTIETKQKNKQKQKNTWTVNTEKYKNDKITTEFSFEKANPQETFTLHIKGIGVQYIIFSKK